MPSKEAQRAMRRANHLIESLTYKELFQWPAFGIHARYMRLIDAIKLGDERVITKCVNALNRVCDEHISRK